MIPILLGMENDGKNSPVYPFKVTLQKLNLLSCGESRFPVTTASGTSMWRSRMPSGGSTTVPMHFGSTKNISTS